MKTTKLKLWTGLGTYVMATVVANTGMANAGAIAFSPVEIAQTTQPETPAQLVEENSTRIAQVTGATACRAVAVSGGGEGGEAESAPVEGGEGGEGGASQSPGSSRTFSPRPSAVPFTDRQILSDFTDTVIIPTYASLAQQSEQLAADVNAFVRSPSASSLQAARQSWIAARSPWEQSEAFAFGPASSLGYDADLDDWPINEVDVKAVLSSQAPLTVDYLASLQTGQKGFQTIAFLLFGSNNDKPLSSFTARDLQYLQAVTTVFDQTADALLTSWTKGVEGNPPYRDEFVQAGSSNAYPTLEAGAAELVQGIMGLLDELANAKMGEPLETQNPFLLESRFSGSSLQDFEANLKSVEITYSGRLSGTAASDRGLSKFVASVDPGLDQLIRQQLQAAQSAVAAIPGPIESTLCDPAAQPKIEAAIGSVLALFTTFEQQVLPLVQE